MTVLPNYHLTYGGSLAGSDSGFIARVYLWNVTISIGNIHRLSRDFVTVMDYLV